jgi:small-conductance mechanosensitive channel
MTPDLATSFVNRYDDELTALGSVVVACVIAALVDRAFQHRVEPIAAERGELSPEASTRLRFVRRLITAVILLLGLMIALSQFGTLNRVATSLLASGVLAAAVIGFAARQVLANAVAGVMLAITQPLRIGDHVEFEGEAGTVEDVRLNYTYLQSPAGTRIVIPNERLAAGILHNDTIVSPLGDVEASFWLPLEADADRGLAALAGLAGVDGVRVAEIAAEGVRLEAAADSVPAGDRPGRAAELRAEGLRALRRAGLLPGAGQP